MFYKTMMPFSSNKTSNSFNISLKEWDRIVSDDEENTKILKSSFIRQS